jgi:hypothetical protein
LPHPKKPRVTAARIVRQLATNGQDALAKVNHFMNRYINEYPPAGAIHHRRSNGTESNYRS